jgi:crossover junction endodeoxyribonuclease RusA
MIHFATSWPAKPLWQNSRGHWGKKARAVADARAEAYAEALAASIACIRGHERYEVIVTFAPSARSRADNHNLPATVKAHIDGIADALQIDDRRIDVTFFYGDKHGATGEVMFSVFPVAPGDKNG